MNHVQYRPKLELFLDGQIPVLSKANRVFLAEGQTLSVLNGNPVSIFESSLMLSITSSSDRIENTSSETEYNRSVSVDRGATGDILRVNATGTIGNNGASPTGTWRLLLGGTEVLELGAVTLGSGSTEVFHLSFEIVLRNASDRSSCDVWVALISGFYGSTPLRPVKNLSTGVDLSGTWDLNLSLQFSAASISNTSVLDSLNLQYLRV
jgi:hypothetical protein